jgi:hypothetical protein
VITWINLHQLHRDDGGDGDGDGDGVIGKDGVDEDAPHDALVMVIMMVMSSPGQRWRIWQDWPSEEETRAICSTPAVKKSRKHQGGIFGRMMEARKRAWAGHGQGSHVGPMCTTGTL